MQKQKAKAAELRRAQQQCKARLIQERRVARAEARVARAKEKANQTAKRAQKQRAQKAEKQLQARIKLAKRGKKEGLKPIQKAIRRNQQVVKAAGGGRIEGAASPPPPSQSRSGRSIKTPSRFK